MRRLQTLTTACTLLCAAIYFTTAIAWIQQRCHLPRQYHRHSRLFVHYYEPEQGPIHRLRLLTHQQQQYLQSQSSSRRSSFHLHRSTNVAHTKSFVFSASSLSSSVFALAASTVSTVSQQPQHSGSDGGRGGGGNVHGQGSCFLPLNQLSSDYYAPRIIQIAGAYPGLTRQEFLAVQSEPAADLGQWTYDFSDPDDNGRPQLGTIAVDGNDLISNCEDPVVVIASHTSIGVELPEAVQEDVDLVVLIDRSQTGFDERKFLVIDSPSMQGQLLLRAYASHADLPKDAQILGRVILVQIPWLPCMQPSKTGFMEADEYY